MEDALLESQYCLWVGQYRGSWEQSDGETTVCIH